MQLQVLSKGDCCGFDKQEDDVRRIIDMFRSSADGITYENGSFIYYKSSYYKSSQKWSTSCNHSAYFSQ